jgi:GTP-binding protein HflX
MDWTKEGSDSLRGFLVGIDMVGHPQVLDTDSSLEELGALADTVGIQVVGQLYQRVKVPDPSTFIGSGKVEEVLRWVEELKANIVIFDVELLPRHQRELEQRFGDTTRIIDRTGLILDIFAQHARTREGALQVALAQYEYLLPRLTRQWTHLARQAGGAAARGGVGGVGLRGPGETQLETDRRDIRRRIARLRHEIEVLRTYREKHRVQRRRRGIPSVALVGYTNAGKSTLLNRLSGSSIYVADQLFATLDPTVRRVTLPEGRIVLVADTVGFIQKLPHTLIAAFRATLEEINQANLIIHVVDASHPDAERQAEVVEETLFVNLGIRDVPILTVLNKIDLMADVEEQSALDSLRDRYPLAVSLSARTGAGLDRLLETVANALDAGLVRVVVCIPYVNGALISRFHEIAMVEAELHGEESVQLTGMVASSVLADYRNYIV